MFYNDYSSELFEKEFTYTGDDLGATWTQDKTTFRVWAPTAQMVRVNLYQGGQAGINDMIEQLIMTPDINGTWVAERIGDLHGVYYTYVVDVKGQVNEACDPYAKATGVNGQRAMIINMESTNPAGWDTDMDPNGDLNITDMVIYELHVRDLSIDPSSGIQNAGKYLGVIETGTTNTQGVPTGLDHIKNLGATHIHFLPFYDYGSVDESRLDEPQFNWGYDPVNYNVPEGSYSSDPFHGEVRVTEMKQMIKGLHDNGISVIMDVVYNHVYSLESYCFNRIVPQYFSRLGDNGSYSNGSGCGNDTASERAMVKKYIVDSVKYWADEYHIDGFRFDLVGLIDTETINAVMKEVHKNHPHVIFYGEGWTMSTNVTKSGYTMTTQWVSEQVPGFAFFSDNIRDMLKGTVFDNYAQGYVSGAAIPMESVKECFLGIPAWCKTPAQSINYVSCHDNMSLYDRLIMSTPDATVEERIRMNKLAAAFYMMAQGVPFMQAGEEMLRSKPLGDGTFDHNSYASPDSVNSLKWDDLNKVEYQNVYKYYQGLIAFRKAHAALRMTNSADVWANITAFEGMGKNVAAFRINGAIHGETGDGLMVIFNPNKQATTVVLPEGNWNVYVTGEIAGVEALASVRGAVVVDPISAMVLVKEDALVEEPKILLTPVVESKMSEQVQCEETFGEEKEVFDGDAVEEKKTGKGNGIVIGAAVAAVAAAGAAAAVILKKKK
ncbi:MAG: type I pullulanase [Lachnospiraceae bacterium]|nr:type I pullulanase [Lachnospiraceae bacterium]